MEKIKLDYEAFIYNVPIKEFEKNVLSFVEKYLKFNLIKRKLNSNQLKPLLMETINIGRKFMIYRQIEILKLFFLTIAFGINFYNERKYIFIEAELNNIRNAESVRIQNCCNILTQEDYLDLKNNEDKELYTLLTLKFTSPIKKFSFAKAMRGK